MAISFKGKGRGQDQSQTGAHRMIGFVIGEFNANDGDSHITGCRGDVIQDFDADTLERIFIAEATDTPDPFYFDKDTELDHGSPFTPFLTLKEARAYADQLNGFERDGITRDGFEASVFALYRDERTGMVTFEGTE